MAQVKLSFFLQLNLWTTCFLIASSLQHIIWNVCFVVFLIFVRIFLWFLGLQHAFFHFVQFQHCFQSLATMFDKDFTLRPTIVIINSPRPSRIHSTTTKRRNVVMVPWGAREGEGQNNVAIYMAFLLVFYRGVGT